MKEEMEDDMTTKEWLNRGRNLNEEINALIKAKEKALYDACNVSIAYDKEKSADKSE